MTEWTGFALMMERVDLDRDAAVVSRLLFEEDGSAKADAYVAEHRVAERLAAFKAAGGLR